MDVLGSVFRHGEDSSLLLCSKTDLGGFPRLLASQSGAQLGRDLQLDGSAFAGEGLGDPAIGADGRARVFHGFDLARAAGEASGKVDYLNAITSASAADGDAVADPRGRVVRGGNV